MESGAFPMDLLLSALFRLGRALLGIPAHGDFLTRRPPVMDEADALYFNGGSLVCGSSERIIIWNRQPLALFIRVQVPRVQLVLRYRSRWER